MRQLWRQGGGAPCELPDRWHLGSDTKAFTATLAAVCVESGQLGWNTTVAAALLPTVPDLEIHKSYRDVTLLELLSNTGGAPGVAPADCWALAWDAASRGGAPSAQRREYVRALLALAPACPRGRFEYSNQGFAIAGHMLETVTAVGQERATSAYRSTLPSPAPRAFAFFLPKHGRHSSSVIQVGYEELLANRVLAPLGITTAGFGAAAGRDEPWGHASNDGAELVPKNPAVELDADNPTAIAPAGRLHMSLPDWGRFVAAVVSPQIAEERLGLARPAFEKLHAPVVQTGDGPEDGSYGLGWLVVRRPWAAGGVALTHSGSNSMNYCTAWVVPGGGGGGGGSGSGGRLESFAVLVASNAGGEGARAAVSEACTAVIEAECQAHGQASAL